MKKSDRIKNSKEFDNLIKVGKKVKNDGFIISFSDKKTENIRFGIAVGTKIGNAVTRNKLKRQTREIIREIKNKFQNTQDYIIIVRKACLKLNYNEMKENLIELAEKVKN